MVYFATSLLAAATLAGLSNAAPMPDSALGEEVGVSAPFGIPLTDTVELASQSAAEAASSAAAALATGSIATTDNNNMYGQATASQAVETSIVTSFASTATFDAYGSMVTSGSYGSSYNNGYGSNNNNNYGYGSSNNNYNNGYGSNDNSYNNGYGSSNNNYNNGYSNPMYGSGSSNWGNGGYDNCVQQCIAEFGSPMGSYTPSATMDMSGGSYGGSYGSGATHTVIVAPTQGVLRYLPFAVNASIGDTVKFVWGAGPHTVTKSSQLEICNKTLAEPFTSGSQNKSFVFTQVVNSTDPTFFYCGVPSHCQKGMFGIINPTSNIASPNSFGNMAASMMASDSSMAAMGAYANNMTMGNVAISTWGNSMDMSGFPNATMSLIAENILYTRTFLAANPEVVSPNGDVNLGASGSAPMSIPQDITSAMSASSSSTSGSGSSGSASAASSSASSAATAAGAINGARSLASSSGAAVVVAAVVAFFAL